jgi:predicted regulator of Ras-like GTPase activity (Roadblock/LC7/MglB family)
MPPVIDLLMARKYVDFVLRIRDMSVATMFDMDLEQIQGKIKEIMEEATTTAAGIKAAILLSKEGLPILAAERMEQGTLEEVLMTNEKGLVIMRSAGEKAILVLAASKNVKTGLLVYAARTASEKIAPLL